MLEPTKKDIQHPKTKRPQQDGRRDTIVIKWNPIPIGWANHKLENNYTTEVLPLEWKFWAPHQTSQSGGLAMGGGVSRESGFESQQDLITGLPQDWGKQTPLLEGTHKVFCAPGPRRKKHWPHKRLGQTYLLVLESLLPSWWGVALAHCGDEDTGSSSSGKYSLGWALLEATISPTKQTLGSSAGLSQAKQPTGRNTPISREVD